MLNKLTEIKDTFVKKIRRISITFTVTVHLIYIAYLLFAIDNNIGIGWVNALLAIGTGIFLITYLVIRLTMQNAKSKIKTTKKFYRRFRLATRLFSTATAIYAIVTAVGSVSPLAVFFAGVSAILLVIRLIFEALLYTIESKARKIKESINNRLHAPKNDNYEYVVNEFEEVESCYIGDDD